MTINKKIEVKVFEDGIINQYQRIIVDLDSIKQKVAEDCRYELFRWREAREGMSLEDLGIDSEDEELPDFPGDYFIWAIFQNPDDELVIIVYFAQPGKEYGNNCYYITDPYAYEIFMLCGEIEVDSEDLGGEIPDNWKLIWKNSNYPSWFTIIGEKLRKKAISQEMIYKR